MGRSHCIAAVACLLLVGCGDAGRVAAPEPGTGKGKSQTVSAVIPKRQAAVVVDREIAAFYQDHRFRPLWVDSAGFTDGGRRLLAILADAGSDGLDPARYDVAELRKLAAAPGRDPAAMAHAELLASRSFVRYARDLYRPHPGARPYFVDEELAPRVPNIRPLLEGAARAPQRAAHLERLRAINPLYDSLRRAFSAHRGGLDRSDSRIVLANLERARALGPIRGRAVIVDAAGANLWMVNDGRVEGAMKAVVGKPAMPTPAMAGFIRYVSLNPYWNVPPDLARERARRVLRGGLGAIRAERLQVLSGWSADARPVELARVDWRAAASGKIALRMRQLPGRDNMMGQVKFMFPNRLGIYLHDTPFRDKFGLVDRGASSGCVRVANAPLLSRWLFGGTAPEPGRGAAEQRVDLPEPVPVYITYLTAAPASRGIVFQPDRYRRDARLLAVLRGGRERAGGV